MCKTIPEQKHELKIKINNEKQNTMTTESNVNTDKKHKLKNRTKQ